MINHTKLIVSSIVMLILDFINLHLRKNYYSKFFYNIQKSNLKLNYIGALFAYISMILLLNIFILNENKISYIKSFLLGIFVYMVYDGTNLATFKNWTFYFFITDVIWGGILFLLTTYITVNII